MAAMGITVLKSNAPWGPFTRAQIADGLGRGDFTLQYLAHAPGLKEWLPLGEVLDYVERSEGPRLPTLPPVPGPRELPPVPEPLGPRPEPPTVVLAPAPPPRPPILPAPAPRATAPPAPVSLPPASPSPLKSGTDPAPGPSAPLTPASFFPRGVAFLLDCAILFVPVGILYATGALSIELPGAWNHISHQTRMEDWELLDQNTRRLAWLVALGFGWLYGAGLECSRAQATIGKRWVGIMVTDAGGARVSFLRATGRYAAKYLSALPCFLGFIMALFGSRNLALHDRLAGTRVVKR
jgi:uncharacterized RDD family membrane protein YckC